MVHVGHTVSRSCGNVAQVSLQRGGCSCTLHFDPNFLTIHAGYSVSTGRLTEVGCRPVTEPRLADGQLLKVLVVRHKHEARSL